MTCPGDSDRLFGPRVDSSCRQFDFTLEFEDVVFGCIPAAVFIILSPINIFQLLRVSKIGLRQWNMLLACRLVSYPTSKQQCMLNVSLGRTRRAI